MRTRRWKIGSEFSVGFQPVREKRPRRSKTRPAAFTRPAGGSGVLRTDHRNKEVLFDSLGSFSRANLHATAFHRKTQNKNNRQN
jgi:hypothetical protein